MSRRKQPQSVTIQMLQEDIDVLRKALHVFTLDPRLRAFLEAYDPKALQQAEAALRQSDIGKGV